MSLFPEIDLSSYTEGFPPPGTGAPGSPGAPSQVALERPSGNLGGLAQALIHLLANYSPGETGINELDPSLQLTLPYPEWHIWSSSIVYPYTYSAGESGLKDVFTVPDDERAWFDGIHSRIASGDNKLSNISLVMPAGYYEGSANTIILGLTTNDTEIFWPDPAGIQTVERLLGWPPLLLEPGTKVQVNLKGSGVSGGIFSTDVLVRRMKLRRAIAP